MELVLDANVLFSALIRESHTRHLIIISGWTFYMPEYALEEVYKHIEVIEEKSGLTKKEIKDLIDELIRIGDIHIVSFNDFKLFMENALEISQDPDDAPYLALAMKTGCSI